jgi:hypothetical protein
MSNFYETARSNYFRVKDAESFRRAMAALPSINVWSKAGPDGVERYAVASDDPDTGTWPTCGYNDETGEDIEYHMPTEIAPHLVDGEVCVLMEAGAEKLRYISGWAVAFDNTDRPVVQVSLNDIYDKAKAAFGVEPTDASY